MRLPVQVLVLPYRLINNEVEYAIFKRSDYHFWQFIAGGGEETETIMDTAYRELREEIGLQEVLPLIQLHSICTIPRHWFSESHHWPTELYVVPEHCFAVDLVEREPIISEEHLEYRWANYDTAFELLKWDSNKNALWELRERLKR